MSGDEAMMAEPATTGVLAQDQAPKAAQTRGVPGWERTAVDEAIRPLAVSGMLTCIAVSIAQFVNAISSEWPGTFFVLLVLAVSLESIHSRRLLSRLNLYPRDRFRYRFVEWVVILLVVRFGPYLKYGSERLWADIAVWSVNVGAFFDIGFIVNSLLIVVFWALANTLSQALDELEASPMERRLPVTDPNHYLRSTMPRHGRINRQASLSRITGVFLGGGVALLVIAGLVQVDVRDLVTLQHLRSSGIILNVLVYFLIGFLLISHARFSILKANWTIQGIPMLGHVAQRWLALVMIFLLGLGIISTLLPVGYSVGILETVSTIIQWIIYALVQFVFLILFIVSSLLGLLMSLFRGPEAAFTPPMQRAEPPPPPSSVSAGPAPWWQLVRSLIFWTVLVGIIGYSLYHFMGYRWAFLQRLAPGVLLGWLRRIWRGLRRGTGRLATRIRQEIARRLTPRQAEGAPGRLRFLSLHRLSPRDKVLYFYVSVLRRSAKQGFGRPKSRTPLEYEETLRRELPEALEQVHELTDAFIEARYSAHELDSSDSTIAQRAWRSVKRALSGRRRRAARARSDAVVE